MFGNFYNKSDYDRMNIVWMTIIKITFRYKISKKDMSLYYIFNFTLKNNLILH